METLFIIAVVVFLAVITLGGLYFRVVGERIMAMYFYGMMWNGQISGNHSKKLNDLVVESINTGVLDEDKRAEFDRKSSLAWQTAMISYPHGFEYRIGKRIDSLYTEEQKKAMLWDWD